MIIPVDPHLYATYLVSAAVMALTPGPANVFAVATGVERGKLAALRAVAGMNLATLMWFCAAAAGLAAMIVTFPPVFRIAAIGGGLYVAWLGVRALIAAWKGDAAPAHATRKPSASPFRDGFLVQISNPKLVIFFSAVLPPFIDPQRPIAAQMVMFAIASISLDSIAESAYGLFGATLSARMQEPRFRRGFSILVGCLLLSVAGLILSRL
jgi:threonine/homoserine/homoserine lactone efflux protein